MRDRMAAIEAALEAADIDLGDYYARAALLRMAALLYLGVGDANGKTALGDLRRQIKLINESLAGSEAVQP